MKFKKTGLKEIIIYKVKWLLKIINYPFKKLESWM